MQEMCCKYAIYLDLFRKITLILFLYLCASTLVILIHNLDLVTLRKIDGIDKYSWSKSIQVVYKL